MKIGKTANRVLAEKMVVSEEVCLAIDCVNAALTLVLDNPEDHRHPLATVEGMEYLLQELWGFPQDADYHRYWKEVKDCCCPKLDNEDALYFGRRIYSGDCPWHSKGIKRDLKVIENDNTQ